MEHIKKIIQKMMLQKKEKLVLVEIKPIDFKDKDTGAIVKKYKYTFLNEAGEIRSGYDEKEKLKDRVVDTDKFIPEKSFEYSFEGKVWNDVLSWRLLV